MHDLHVASYYYECMFKDAFVAQNVFTVSKIRSNCNICEVLFELHFLFSQQLMLNI